MNPDIDVSKETFSTFDNLLDEINKYKRSVTQLQSENRTFKTAEIRLKKSNEAIKTENHELSQELAKLSQQVRELEIQLTLPTSERTFTINKTVDPYPKKKAYQTFTWSYIVIPIVAVFAVFAGRKWAENDHKIVQMAASSLAAATTNNPTPTPTPNVQSAPVEEGYLVVENPIIADDPVKLRDGYNQRARELAWVTPGEKYKIRAKSPAKMTRTIIINGNSTRIEDYFYKISDKEQWVFGFFTNRREYIPK
jgi:anion-transporting  ArsA/GET3 family ATPase